MTSDPDPGQLVLIHHKSACRFAESTVQMHAAGRKRDPAGPRIWKIVDHPPALRAAKTPNMGPDLQVYARREGFEPPTARSVVSHYPSPPFLSYLFASPLLLVNGFVARRSRAFVPACHVRLGRNVVAGSGHRRQIRSLATHRLPVVWVRAPDSRSGASSTDASSALAIRLAVGSASRREQVTAM